MNIKSLRFVDGLTVSLVAFAIFSAPSFAHADYASTVLGDAPAAYWRLGEATATSSSFFTDTFTGTDGTLLSSHVSDSGQGWTIHPNFAPTASIQSNAVKNTVMGGISVYYANAVPTSPNYTVEAKVTSVTASGMGTGIAGRMSTSTSDFYFLRILGSSNTVDLFKSVAGVSTRIASSTFTPVNGTTYTLKLVMDGSTIKGYVNDVERVSVTDTSITAAGRAGLRLSRSATGDDSIDDMSVYATALNAADQSGNNIRGSYLPSSATSWPGGTLGVAGALAGDSDTSAMFNGLSGNVTVADNAALRFGAGDFSLEFWAKAPTMASSSKLLGKRAAAGTTAGYQVSIATSTFSFLTDGGAAAPISISNGITRSDNTWYHVVALRENGTLKLYVNGVVSAATATQTGNLDDATIFQIGTNDNSNFFNGQMDEVAVYNKALTAGQVLAHYEVGTAAANHTPIVSNLGPSDHVDGSTTNDNTPTLTFTTSDSDSNTVSYVLQVDNNSDFSSPTYAATSTYAATGSVSTTTSVLPDGSYYWRVLVGDGQATSSYVTARSGQVAFVVDTGVSMLTITSPRRDVVASSTTATISYVDQKGVTVYIPYIQTSQDLSVAASAGTGLVPVGGGVKFILNQGQAGERSLTDLSSPYSGTFTNLPKDTYTLDAYVVDGSGSVQAGAGNHDTAVNIGIGDIYIAIGDSITKGAGGLASTTCIASGNLTNWTQSLPGTASLDGRNYCQWSLQQPQYFKSWMPELNNELAAYNDYPVFILNEGYGGYAAAGFLSNPMASSTWQSRINSLNPNKWFVLLGTNDTTSTTTLVANMTSIVNTLKTTYHASSTSIYVGLPLYADSRPVVQTYIAPLQNMVTALGVKKGPNFSTYFQNHPELYFDNPPIHPNPTGYLQMSRLWGLSVIAPQNLSVSATTTGARVSWNSVTPLDSIPTGTPNISGYRVKYGTSTGNYATTTDVGNALSANITGLAPNQTYYFTVDAYGPTAEQNFSDIAPEVSFLNVVDVTAPIVSGVATSSVTDTGVTVTWTTDEAATSQVEYGTTTAYAASTTVDLSLLTSHSVTLTGLTASTTYHYRVISRDASNNLATSSDFTFTTADEPPEDEDGGSSGSSGGGSGRSGGSVRKPTDSGTTAASPVPAVSVSFTRDLDLKSTGDDVRALQALLISKGLLAAGNDTGFFGPLTQAALARYQASAGIAPAAGYFGPLTRSMLAQETAGTPVATVPPPADPAALSPVAASPAPIFTYSRDLTLGSKGADVKGLQIFLNSRGYAVAVSGSGSAGFETDYFGPATRAALARFQAASGISPAAGYFGPVTRQRISGL